MRLYFFLKIPSRIIPENETYRELKKNTNDKN